MRAIPTSCVGVGFIYLRCRTARPRKARRSSRSGSRNFIPSRPSRPARAGPCSLRQVRSPAGARHADLRTGDPRCRTTAVTPSFTRMFALKVSDHSCQHVDVPLAYGYHLRFDAFQLDILNLASCPSLSLRPADETMVVLIVRIISSLNRHLFNSRSHFDMPFVDRSVSHFCRETKQGLLGFGDLCVPPSARRPILVLPLCSKDISDASRRTQERIQVIPKMCLRRLIYSRVR